VCAACPHCATLRLVYLNLYRTVYDTALGAAQPVCTLYLAILLFRLYTLDTLPEFTELPPSPHEPIVPRNDELDILQLMIECPTLSKAQE